MSLAEDYAAAWLPDRWTILGVTLRPMVIGHVLILTRLKNHYAPFIPHTKSPTLLDVCQGLYVCSRSWSSAAGGVQRRRTGWRWRYWAWLIQRCGESHAMAVVSAWQKYVIGQQRIPRMWSADKSARRKSPLIQIIIAYQLANCGQGVDTVLDVPLQIALWEMAAAAEKDGQMTFVGDRESELIERFSAPSSDPSQLPPEPSVVLGA